MYLVNHQLWYLVIGIPSLLLFSLYWLYKKQNRYFKELGEPKTLKQQINYSSKIKKWELSIFISAVVLILLALLRPQWGATQETVKKNGLDIVVALDISKSMQAEDVRPSRSKKAVSELNKLLSKLSNHRVGLITFAGSATTICPLTTDFGAIQLFLKTIEDYQEPLPGTNIEKAFTTALDLYDYNAAQDRIFLLITDGENHQGNLKRIKSQAQEKAIIIIPVAVGTSGGQPIPVFNEKGERTGYKKNKQNQIIISHLNLENLQQIANLGPYQIEDSYSALPKIINDLKAFKTGNLKELKTNIYAEQYQIFLLIGFILLIISYLLSDYNGIKKFKKGFKNV